MFLLDNLIRSVVELDKLKRLELKKLEDEKAKLGSFIREERKTIEKEYKEEAKKIYSERKNETDKIIEEAQIKAKADYENRLKDLEQSYKENKQKWVDDLYSYCIGLKE